MKNKPYKAQKFNRIVSLVLSLAILFSITAGINFSAQAASYNSDYKRWSQGKSSYSWMKNYGCWVVAEAKLIYETGINKSSSFNPDVYYKWVTDKGYVNNSGNVYSDNPVRYAKALGNNKLSYSGVTTSNLSNTVINNSKNGYYSIIKVKTSSGGTHYIMANKDKTKSTGNVYIYDSWNSSNEPPATFAWSDVKSKVGGAYTMTAVYTFKYSGTTSVTNPSVSVKGASNITSNSARIDFTANNPSNVSIKTIGVQVRMKGSGSWTTKSEAMNASYVTASSVPMWWTVGKGKELNMTLYSGITYEYRAYVVYNGTNYYSATKTFTTSGTHSHNYSMINKVESSCTQHGKITYQCAVCGEMKEEQLPLSSHVSYFETSKNPTCTENGYWGAEYCYYCKKTIKEREIIPAYGHSYSWKTQNGFKIKSCNTCGNISAKLTFTDINTYDEYNDYIAYTSVYNKFITGTNPPKNNVFSPKTAITRAMFVTILYRMAGSPYDNGKNPYGYNPFSDVLESAYYYNSACWALRNGITTEKKFNPDSSVSREQTAAFLFRYAQNSNKLGNNTYKSVNLTKYPDYNSIHDWAVEPMKWANYNQMITGTQQGYLNPQGATQRIHATKILYGFGKTCNIGNFE